MALNKKQKKKLDVARKKQLRLRQLLTAARAQTDDPAEVIRLQSEIAAVDEEIKKIQND